MLAPAVHGDHFRFGPLAAYAAGEGAPALLLVHSVNAAASVAEVAPLFETWKARRRVFALDLPGFGTSERPDIAYTPRVMTDALHACVAEMRRRGVTGPIDALAVSLGCEFLARAAVERPAEFGRLAMVSPTALNGSTPRRGPPGGTKRVPGLHGALAFPWWSGALFNGLTKPGVVRFFLEKTFGSKQIDEAMWAYAVATAREPGARHAPLHFLSGGLFSADAFALYESLPQPVWACHGTRGDFTDYRLKGQLPKWSFSVFEAGALPYFEQPAAFDAALSAFLR